MCHSCLVILLWCCFHLPTSPWSPKSVSSEIWSAKVQQGLPSLPDSGSRDHTRGLIFKPTAEFCGLRIFHILLSQHSPQLSTKLGRRKGKYRKAKYWLKEAGCGDGTASRRKRLKILVSRCPDCYCSVVFDSLTPHGLQHARFLCPSPSGPDPV